MAPGSRFIDHVREMTERLRQLEDDVAESVVPPKPAPPRNVRERVRRRRPARAAGRVGARIGIAIGWLCSRFWQRLETPCPQGEREGRPHWWGDRGRLVRNGYRGCTCCARRWMGDTEPRDPGPPPESVFRFAERAGRTFRAASGMPPPKTGTTIWR